MLDSFFTVLLKVVGEVPSLPAIEVVTFLVFWLEQQQVVNHTSNILEYPKSILHDTAEVLKSFRRNSQHCFGLHR